MKRLSSFKGKTIKSCGIPWDLTATQINRKGKAAVMKMGFQYRVVGRKGDAVLRTMYIAFITSIIFRYYRFVSTHQSIEK